MSTHATTVFGGALHSTAPALGVAVCSRESGYSLAVDLGGLVVLLGRIIVLICPQVSVSVHDKRYIVTGYLQCIVILSPATAGDSSP